MAPKTATKEVAETIPAFRDKKEVLVKLKKSDFPRSKKGKVAFCDYMIEVYKERKIAAQNHSGEREKIEKRITLAKKKLAALERSLEGTSAK